MMRPELAPSLANILNRKSLRWIFVGGKGGVGKTTCSSSLAVLMATVRRSVLIVSTDPAHNLSDAFSQKFTKTPSLVQGFSNLYAMEVDASFETSTWSDDVLEERNQFAEIGNMLAKMCSSVPGIDEMVSFAEVMKLIRDMDFEVIIFDTAPTGHTLRLLSLPQAIEKVMSQVMRFRSSIFAVIKQVTALTGVNNANESTMLQKLENIFPVVQEVNAQFKNPEMTTFVCVCIAEFLSLYETERLVQDLAKQRMDTQNIIVNQLLFPKTDDDHECKMCLARHKIQQKYLNQIHDLYADFNVIELPLLDHEVRGVDAIKAFSKYLTIPYGSATSCTEQL